MTVGRLAQLLVFVLCVPFTAAPVSAQEDDTDARGEELFENGFALFEEGAYEAALIAWTEGWEVTGEPLFLYNMASAYERLSDFDAAIEVLNEYRAYAPSDEREALSRRIERLRERRNESLEPDPDPAPEEPVAEPIETPPDPSPTSEERGLFGPTQWTFTVLATASLAIASVLAQQARSYWRDADSRCENALCLSSAEDDFDRGRRTALWADVSFGVAGASAVALALSLVLRRPLDAQDDSTSVSVRVQPQAIRGLGVIVQGSF